MQRGLDVTLPLGQKLEPYALQALEQVRASACGVIGKGRVYTETKGHAHPARTRLWVMDLRKGWFGLYALRTLMFPPCLHV